MGGRGANFSRTVSPPIQTQQLQPDPLNGTQPPTGVTQTALANMSDQELHDFLIDVNKTDIPSFLSDLHLQRMLYAMGMNGKPEVVDQNTFDGLAQNSPVLYRTVNDTVVNGVPFTSSDCCDMLIDGDLTFVGRGIHGDGLYFSNSLSGSKAYGDHTGQTVGAVLNSKARVISETQLRQDYDAFVKSHPQARKALGFAKSHSTHDSYSQFALIRGYNVISSDQYGGETYYTVLDRSALTMTNKRY